MRQVEWLVRWFSSEDWRTWISHFLLVFFISRAVLCGLNNYWVYGMVVLVIFGAVVKEYYEYNKYRNNLDSFLDALSYILGALVSAATMGLFG